MEQYEELQMEIIEFEQEDVIITSEVTGIQFPSDERP